MKTIELNGTNYDFETIQDLWEKVQELKVDMTEDQVNSIWNTEKKMKYLNVRISDPKRISSKMTCYEVETFDQVKNHLTELSISPELIGTWDKLKAEFENPTEEKIDYTLDGKKAITLSIGIDE